MSSKISYVTGALDDWFMVPDPESVRKAVEVYGQEAAQTVLDPTWMYRYAQYRALLGQLHSKPVAYCGAEKIKAITKMDNEYILCLWTSMTLVPPTTPHIGQTLFHNTHSGI